MIKQEDGRWYVYNKEGTKRLPPTDGYSNKEGAVKRLRQIEYFKNLNEGVFKFSPLFESEEKTFKPTSAMASAAKRAKEMRDALPDSEKGMTRVGLERMNQLMNREPLYLDTVKRMFSFFSRHEVDKQSKEWKQGNSKGEQGWLGWGGDAGFRWSKAIVKTHETREES